MVLRRCCECGGSGGDPSAVTQQDPGLAARGRFGASVGAFRGQAKFHECGRPRDRVPGSHPGGIRKMKDK